MLPSPLPRLNVNDPEVTANATLVSATALTLVDNSVALIAAAMSAADFVVELTEKLLPPAEPETPMLPAVKAPAAVPPEVAVMA